MVARRVGRAGRRRLRPRSRLAAAVGADAGVRGRGPDAVGRCGRTTIIRRHPVGSGVVAYYLGWWGRNADALGRMGLLGPDRVEACPNLLQRRPGPGPAARRSAEYQRFFSGFPVRSGPLQQIRTSPVRTPSGRVADPAPTRPVNSLRLLFFCLPCLCKLLKVPLPGEG